MTSEMPAPILPAERVARTRRVRRLARQVSFDGNAEYRHVYSQSGGAQFIPGRVQSRDSLIVYAEAFERDANPDDFSLEAIVAHERGHQIVLRNSWLQRPLGGEIKSNLEEILASLAGSLLVGAVSDRKRLVAKATFDAIENGLQPNDAVHLVRELRKLLEVII
jgi:hypothetical protein